MNNHILTKLSQLSLLEPHWDTYNAIPPNPLSISISIEIINHIDLPLSLECAIDVFPLLDGGVSTSLTWQNKEFEFDIYNSGKIFVQDFSDTDLEIDLIELKRQLTVFFDK